MCRLCNLHASMRAAQQPKCSARSDTLLVGLASAQDSISWDWLHMYSAYCQGPEPLWHIPNSHYFKFSKQCSQKKMNHSCATDKHPLGTSRKHILHNNIDTCNIALSLFLSKVMLLFKDLSQERSSWEFNLHWRRWLFEKGECANLLWVKRSQ